MYEFVVHVPMFDGLFILSLFLEMESRKAESREG